MQKDFHGVLKWAVGSFVVVFILIAVFVYKEIVAKSERFFIPILYLRATTQDQQIVLNGFLIGWSFKNMHDCAFDSGRADCNDGVNTYMTEVVVKEGDRTFPHKRNVVIPDFRREPTRHVSSVSNSEYLSDHVKAPVQSFYLPSEKMVVFVGLPGRWPEDYYNQKEIAPLAVEPNTPVNLYFLSWKDGSLIQRERRWYFPRIPLTDDMIVTGALLAFHGPESDFFPGLGSSELVRPIENVEALARNEVAALKRASVPVYQNVQFKLFKPSIASDPNEQLKD